MIVSASAVRQHMNESISATRRIRVAVRGTGSIGSRHLRLLGTMGLAEVMAVPHRRQRLAELRAEGFVAVEDMSSAVAHGAQAVIIASETGRHAEDVTAALEMGLDVLVEKPMAVHATQAHQLCELAARVGRKLYVGCVLRFSDSLNAFQELLGRVGELHSVRIECQSYLPHWRPGRDYRTAYSARTEEGGVLRDLIHEVDYAGWIFGWPTAIQARVANLGRLGIAAEEIADLLWPMPAGGVVSIGLDYLSNPPRRWIHASGARGTITWDGIAGTVMLTIEGMPPRIVTSSQTREELFVAQAQAFLNATRGQVDPRLATGEDGVKALAICDAARLASLHRSETRVTYP